MKVIFTHKNGREQPMQRRYADILRKLKRGTYMTRDMQAAPGVSGLSESFDGDQAAGGKNKRKSRTRKPAQTKPAGEQE